MSVFRGGVYLAGPISGCSYKECTDWREGVAEKLEAYDIVSWSPMRHSIYPEHIMSQGRSIVSRDRNDIERSDLVLVNFLGATQVSIGTVWEIGYAWATRTPVVLAMEEKGNVHEHSFVTEHAGFRVDSLDDAVSVIVNILVPD